MPSLHAVAVEVKSCFTVLDDDGSNEVTPFEFKQFLVGSRFERATCNQLQHVEAEGLPSLWFPWTGQTRLQGASCLFPSFSYLFFMVPDKKWSFSTLWQALDTSNKGMLSSDDVGFLDEWSKRPSRYPKNGGHPRFVWGRTAEARTPESEPMPREFFVDPDISRLT